MDFFRRLKKQLNISQPQQLKRECLWLWAKIRKYRNWITVVGILALASTVMNLVSSVASKYLIDVVTGYSRMALGKTALIMGLMMLGGLVLQAFSSRVSAHVHVRVRNQMQYKTYSCILRTSWENMDSYRSGDLLSRMNSDINVVADGIIGLMPSLLSTGVRFVGAFVIIAYFDPMMALIALAGAPVTMVISHYLMKRLRRHSLDMKQVGDEVMSFQEDSLRNLTSIKAFSVVDRYRSEMGRVQDQYAQTYLSFHSFRISMSTLLSLVSMCVMATCFGWGVYQLWAGNITYGSMTMFLQLAGVLRSAFSSILSLMQQGISMTTSAGRIMAVEELPGENMQTDPDLEKERSVEIAFRQVAFHYQNGDAVLHPFDFQVSDGDYVAIMGPSGEGKTTLLRLLLGLVEPCSGEAVLLGGSGKQYDISAATRSAFAQCHRILTDRGMQTSQENPSEAYEVPYRDPNSHLYIELHKYLFPPQSEAYGDLNRFFETVRERAVSVQIQGHTVYTLDPTSHLFYLICHAFKHFLHSGFGIRQVCDIVLYANAYGEAVDWEQILQQCREIHGDKFAAALFAIGRKYLVFDPVRACWPQSWQDILVDERPMLEDLLAGGLYGGASMSRKHSSSITLEAVTARKQDKKRGNALLHSAFPSAEKLQQRYPYLQKHRFLLPLAWCSRLWTYRKETRNTADNNAAEALKIGAERVELMKLYGIVE